MANNLKLEVFRISLKKKNKSDTDLCCFRDLFNVFDSQKSGAYKKFIQDFITYFDGEFRLNADRNKGISSSTSRNHRINVSNNVINGEVYGGPTDMEQTIYKRNNARQHTGTLKTDDITTLPFFYKLWTPYDYTTGVLMVQSYTNATITKLLQHHLQKFIQQYGYSLIFTPYIPKKVSEHYRENANVYKVTYVKEGLSKSKRKLINPIFAEFEDLKIRIEVSGFKKSVHNFWDEFNENRPISSNLEDFDIREEEDYTVVASYVDSEGHKASTSVKKDFEINPTIFLPNNLKKEDSNLFNFDKMIAHSDMLLENIKKEINYN